MQKARFLPRLLLWVIKMTRSDIGVIAIIYATCALFLYMTFQLKAAAQIYPLCLIAGLALLNTLYLLRCFYRMFVSHARRVINDMPEIFSEFLPQQFFFLVFGAIAYLALLYYLGFYLAGVIYLICTLWGLKVRPLPLAGTVIIMGILIYGVFTLFLKVPLPKGILFS